MKGILLCGGKGTRLQPATFAMNKHMVPILNKPMILYPIETLRALGIEDILVVSGGNHIGAFADFLGDGKDYKVNLTYKVQRDSGGIAQALGLAEDYARHEKVAVILGDNIFDNIKLINNFITASPDRDLDYMDDDFAYLFVKGVDKPNRFGVLNKQGDRIDEKPEFPETNKAITGLYIYPNEVFDIIPTLKTSARGELEITDVNNYFLQDGNTEIVELSGFWSDAGTPESMAAVTKWAYNNLSLDK